MTHQFHQEEQKRLKEANMLHMTSNDGSELDGVLFVAKADVESFLPKSNTRAMKHILEELLAEASKKEKLKSLSATGTFYHYFRGINEERARIRTLITKKLSDIALKPCTQDTQN